jgi:site-specific DNA-methyltransferase (adenine-specific)
MSDSDQLRADCISLDGASNGLPAPYYSDDLVTLYHGDCREILPHVQSAAAVITDPPYNVGIEYGTGTDDVRADYSAWCAQWFGECRRVAPVIALTPGIANLGLWFNNDPPDWTLAWHKPAAMGRCHVGFNNWEPILLWGKPRQQTADVITAPLIPDPGLDGHPCPKPMKWATALVGMFSAPGDLVIDPFCGSGTTMRAARDMGRRYVGIEVEERFCEMATRRLDQGAFAFGDAA